MDPYFLLIKLLLTVMLRDRFRRRRISRGFLGSTNKLLSLRLPQDLVLREAPHSSNHTSKALAGESSLLLNGNR